MHHDETPPHADSWNHVELAAPELAGAVRARFEATGLGLLATLRADGSPRISGIEPWFGDGDLWLGMMHRSLKAADLLADPRCALHAATVDKEVQAGDAKITGRAVEVTDPAAVERALGGLAASTGAEPPPGPMHLFRLLLREVVLVEVARDHLVLTTWNPGGGTRTVDRY